MYVLTRSFHTVPVVILFSARLFNTGTSTDHLHLYGTAILPHRISRIVRLRSTTMCESRSYNNSWLISLSISRHEYHAAKPAICISRLSNLDTSLSEDSDSKSDDSSKDDWESDSSDTLDGQSEYHHDDLPASGGVTIYPK